MRKLTILGATGSIGLSTLTVVENNIEDYEVFALTANTGVNPMLSLCLKWQPKFVAMVDEKAAKELNIALKQHGLKTEVLSGVEGVCSLAEHVEVDIVMSAIVGAAGLLPTMSAVAAGKRILLANKESLVMTGQFFIDAVRKYGAELLPVDSEHNAIFQCLASKEQTQLGYCDLDSAGIQKILLTGSGGPFRYRYIDSLSTVTADEAVNHPNWSMGPKISVDSATMMNKGLEYIEARWLFNARRDQLEVIIHPQSIIHSMVQYQDGSVIAQMGNPDMCTPIAYAMAYPCRIPSGVSSLDFTQLSELTFLAPDYHRYPCLKLAIDACFAGQAATTILNAANEVAVSAFLNNQISYLNISQLIDAVLQQMDAKSPDSIEEILLLDKRARDHAFAWIKKDKQ